MPPKASTAVNQKTPASPNLGDGRSDDEGQAEGDADAGADPGHGAGAHLVPGQVRGQRHDRGGDGPAALDHPPQDHPLDAGGQRGHHAPQHKDGEPAVDHRLAPDPVGEHPEGDLQDRLGQPVGADGEPDQERRRPG